MATNYGETSWDEGNRAEFHRLRDGSNNHRIFTKPHKFLTHRVKFADDPNRKGGGGRQVKCAMDSCDLCKASTVLDKGRGTLPKWLAEYEVDMEIGPAKPRWYIGTISRDITPNKAGILEIGTLIRNKVKTLAASKKWGDPTRYDVDIVRDSNADSPANYYDVTPDPDKGPLSPEDERLAAEFDLDGMKTRCEPFSNDQIQDAVGRYREWIEAALEEQSQPVAKSRPQKGKPAPARKPTPQEPVEEEEEEPDFSFSSSRES